jgi:hypothetical protein
MKIEGVMLTCGEMDATFSRLAGYPFNCYHNLFPRHCYGPEHDTADTT